MSLDSQTIPMVPKHTSDWAAIMESSIPKRSSRLAPPIQRMFEPGCNGILVKTPGFSFVMCLVILYSLAQSGLSCERQLSLR